MKKEMEDMEMNSTEKAVPSPEQNWQNSSEELQSVETFRMELLTSHRWEVWINYVIDNSFILSGMNIHIFSQ